MVHQNQTAADMIDRSAVIREFSRGVGTPTNKEMKTNSEEGQVEESSKQVPMDPTIKANKQEESSRRSLLSPHKIACIQIEQTEQKKRVQPPCHCHSCSAFFWFAGADSPSLVALEKGKAAADVQLWTENSLKKSKDIRRGLTQYGATLRKRWTKKFSSTKGQHIKLLANVQAALKERDAGNEMEESAWFTMTEPFGSNARARMLTTALNPDHLLECPENLFEQFENRSKHPSQLFYADYHCMYSVSAHRTTLRHSFIPGAFNVTAEKYGQWQDWHDEEVHRFQAVAASVSYLVFESQSEIMNVLWEIFSNLADKLPLPNSNTPSNTDQEQDEASEPIPLPSFIDPQSLYTDLPSRKFTIQDAYQLCNDQLNYCVTELTKLRQSPTAFNRRRNQSEQLQKMAGSCERFVPYLLLVEPQERVLWWLLIVAEARSLLHALKRSREDGTATSRLLYVSKFKSLVTTIRHRSDQLLQIARAQGLNNAKLGTVVPFSVSRRWGDVNKFLREIAFSEPLWKSRFTNQIACKGVIKAIINDLPRVHVFIQEWGNEGMLITRVQEVLMACEPTIVVHGVEGFDEDEHVRHKLYPNLTSHEHKISMQARTQFLATAISAFDEHTDTRFTASDLSELWTLCQRLSLVFYKGLGFDEECLDQAEDVWVCTDPGEVAESGAKLLQPRKKNGHPAVPAAFHTTIPHHIGEEKVSGRKLTVRTRSKLVPVASDSSQSPLRQPTPSTEPTEAETLEELRIPV